METTPVDAPRAALLAKRADLERELAILTRPHQDQGSISFGKRVGDGTAMAVDRFTAVSVQERLLATLEQVEAALAKLDAGTYESCDTCGRPIGAERLHARPWATRCREHG